MHLLVSWSWACFYSTTQPPGSHNPSYFQVLPGASDKRPGRWGQNPHPPAVARGGYHAKITLLVCSPASLSLPECTKLSHLPSPWACRCAGKQIINPNSLSCWAGTSASLAQWEMQAFLQQAAPDKRRWISGGLELGRMHFFF